MSCKSLVARSRRHARASPDRHNPGDPASLTPRNLADVTRSQRPQNPRKSQKARPPNRISQRPLTGQGSRCFAYGFAGVTLQQGYISLVAGCRGGDVPGFYIVRYFLGVTFPAEILPDLTYHLAHYAVCGRSGLVFVGPKGGRLRRNNFNPIWRVACVAAGVPDAHFHDLRHTGGTLAATTGATIKEIVKRLGHSSPRAAMIYQHATMDRDKAIAAGLGKLVRDTRTPKGLSE